MAVNPDFKCVVSADLFRRAMMAQSTEETRYYLNGVRVEPCAEGGVLLVATDGHRLLVFRDIDGFITGGAATISLSKSMTKALTAKPWNHPGWGVMPKTETPRRRFLAVHGDKAATVDFALEAAVGADTAEIIIEQVASPSALVGGFQWVGAQIDGGYPDWRRVVGEPGEGVVTDFVKMAVIRPVVEALQPGGVEGGFRLVPTKDNPEGPLFVVPYHAGPGIGIVMGLRVFRHGKAEPPPAMALPSWLAPAVQAEAA